MVMGHSMIELMITITIFMFLLVGITEIFNVGLKSWNMVAMKTEVQQESSVSINLLKKDLLLTDKNTAELGGTGYEYAVFESAVGESGIFSYNHSTGVPEWQAYILYYTFPRDTDPNKAIDLNKPENKDIKKKLIRKIIKHTQIETAKKLTDFSMYFTDDAAPPVIGEDRIGKPHVLSDHIYEMVLTDNTINNLQAVDIRLVIIKSILENRLAYEKDFAYNVGREKMVTKNTVLLRNTK